MRPSELTRSAVFRLALLYTGLFGTSVVIMLAFIYWTASRYVKGHVEELVTSELAMFAADYDMDGQSGVIGLMRERLATEQSGRWIYLYLDAAGYKVAGNIDAWPRQPPRSDGFYRLPSRVKPEDEPDESEDEPNRIRARAIVLGDGDRLLIGLDDYEVTEMREALSRAVGVGGGLMLVLAIVGSVFMSRLSLHQLDRINRVSKEIMAGDLQRRVPLSRRGDEFDELGTNINAMLDRIGELMQTVRGVTNDIAHDLRLPLARHRARLETALTHPPAAADLEQFLERSIEDVDSILGTFAALLRIANIESGALRQTFDELDLAALVRDAEQLFEPIATARPLELASTIVPRLLVRGNRDLLFQAVSNLLDNATKFTPNGGRIELRLSSRANVAELVVADSGPGIPDDARQKVFDRFYRLDESRSTPGSGLGLSLVRAVVTLHDGSCAIEDNRPGCRVVIQLPCSSVVY